MTVAVFTGIERVACAIQIAFAVLAVWETTTFPPIDPRLTHLRAPVANTLVACPFWFAKPAKPHFFILFLFHSLSDKIYSFIAAQPDSPSRNSNRSLARPRSSFTRSAPPRRATVACPVRDHCFGCVPSGSKSHMQSSAARNVMCTCDCHIMLILVYCIRKVLVRGAASGWLLVFGILYLLFTHCS
jgi:hypothetical protein